MREKKSSGSVVWLITWEWCGEHAKRDDKVAAVLNSRLSPEQVCRFVEFIYTSAYNSLSERLSYATRRAQNPYPALFGALGRVPWEGQITCGHNPWLFARRVDNFSVRQNGEREEQAEWEERPRPNIVWMDSNND
jgi:hypothetical protein